MQLPTLRWMGTSMGMACRRWEEEAHTGAVALVVTRVDPRRKHGRDERGGGRVPG
jgi:hypothetical protein